MVRRLARLERNPPRQGLRLQKSSPGLLSTHATNGPRGKSPRRPAIATLCQAWAATHGPASTGPRIVSRELIALAGHLQPRQLTPTAVLALLARWKGSYAPATYYCLRGYLARLLHTLEPHGLQPIHLPRAKPGRPRRTIAPPDDLRRMLAIAQPYMRLFIFLCVQLALRFTEALSICPRSWDRQHNLITFRKKGGLQHTLPITPEIQRLFEIAPDTDPDTPYVAALKGHGTSGPAIRKAFYQLQRRAGLLTHITPHDLRRTWAVSGYELTKDIRVVAQVMGHESLATTARYLEHRDLSKLRGLFEQLRMPTEVKQ